MNTRTLDAVPYSGTLINDLLDLVAKVEADIDTRYLIEDEMMSTAEPAHA